MFEFRHHLQSVSQGLEVVVGWINAFYATLISLLIGVFLCLGSIGAILGSREIHPAIVWPLTLLWLAINLPYFWHLWKCVKLGERPLMLRVAERQPLWPKLLRPLVCVWWLYLFVVTALFVTMAEHEAGHQFHGPGDAMERAGGIVLRFGGAFALCYFANGFLLLAIASITHREDIIQRVWGKRRTIDLAIATALLFVPAKLLGL
jgi:hypothetical protein